MAMTAEGKERAAAYVRAKMQERRWDAGHLIDETKLDPGTVRTFLKAETYPQTKKRTAIETALGVPVGSIEDAAAGSLELDAAGDPVEDAIRRSTLTRSNQFRLIGEYYALLESQQPQAG